MEEESEIQDGHSAAGGVLEGTGAISEQNIMKIVEVGGHGNRWFCGMKKS